MGVEDVLEQVGPFGWYQVLHYVLTATAFGFTSTWQLFSIVFIGYTNSHHCKLPANLTKPEGLNITDDDFMDAMYPWEVGPLGEDYPTPCHMYNVTKLVNEGVQEVITCPEGWTYNPEGFRPDVGTVVMEWDLVCDKKVYVEHSLTIFNCGVLLGSFLFPTFGDVIGRKNVFFGCMLLMSAFGIGLSFAPNYEGFCALQFITGSFAAGLYMEGYVLSAEMFPTKWRATLAPVTVMLTSVGLCVLALWAYIWRDWRDLQLAASAIGCVFLVYYFFCPESVRWLVAKKRYDEAQKLLESIAKYNGKPPPSRALLEQPDNLEEKQEQEQEQEEKEKGQGLMHNMKHFCSFQKPVAYVCIMSFLLFVNSLMYFAISLMTGSLYGDIYVNFFLVGILEIPALALAILAMYFFGRRYPLCAFQIFSSIVLALAAGAIKWPMDDESYNRRLLITALTLTSKYGVSGAYGVLIIYSQELVPTNVRSSCNGIMAGCGFIGSVISPYFAKPLMELELWLPAVIFSLLSIIGAMLTLILPETMGRPLPETAEQINGWTRSFTMQEKDDLKMSRQKRTKHDYAVENSAFTPVADDSKDATQSSSDVDTPGTDSMPEKQIGDPSSISPEGMNGVNNPAFE